MYKSTEDNADFFADITSRIERLRTNPKNALQVAAEIDALECLIYQAINEILKIPDVFNNPAFDDFIKLDKILKDLFEFRISYPFLYFKEIDERLIPKGVTEPPESFMSEQFNFFIKNCLDLSALPQDQRLQIHALILQIISRPVGQRLIVRLNQMRRATQDTIIKVEMFLRSSADSSLAISPSEQPEDKEILPGNSFADFSRPYKAFRTCAKYRKVMFWYPANACHRSAMSALNFGKETYFAYKPLFISFAHELIHALHFLRGRDRCTMDFDERHGEIIKSLFVANVEELWTIDLGRNLSENRLRAEWGIDSRYSHTKATQGFLLGKREMTFKDVSEIQAKIQSRLAMQTP
jgi:hypothetical protein